MRLSSQFKKLLINEKISPLLYEAIGNLLFTLLLNVVILLTLNISEYSWYATGVTTAVLSSFISIGIPTLAPEFINSNNNPVEKIWDSIKVQVVLIIIYILMIILMPSHFLINIFEKLEINKNLIVISAIYFLSQNIDETVHVFLRLTNKQYTSLRISIASKLAIIIITIISINFYQSGLVTFYLISLTMFFISMIKLYFFIIHGNSLKLKMTDKFFKIISQHFSLWLGNVSNMIFNGMIRLKLGASYGVTVIAMLTIASQIAAVGNTITASLTLNKLLMAQKTDSTKSELHKNLEIGGGISAFISLFILIITITVLGYINHGNTLKNVSYIFIEIILPISIAFSVSIASIPHYQLSQFSGKIGIISWVNFILAITALVTIQLVNSYYPEYIISIYIFMAVGILSSFLIYLISRNIKIRNL